MILKGENNEICVMAYGPCTLNCKDLSLKVNTMYPFRNKVNVEIDCTKTFALKLRIPEWCEGYEISFNGNILSAKDDNGFVTISKEWKKGDIIELNFKAGVKVITVDDSDAASKFPIAVKYGALLFSYHIPEKWEKTDGRPMTALPEGWSWYNAMPAYEEPDIADIHERNGMLKYAFSWNIALDENLSKDDFTVEETDSAGYVWANAPIKLHTHCYKAPDMWAPYQCKTYEPFGKYQRVTEKLPLVLEPYGCTNLRITYFPRAERSCVAKLKGDPA